MKEMKYSTKRRFEILHEEDYKGYKIVIVNLGTHPTAYIGVTKGSILYEVSYDKLSEDGYYGIVHGGFTYSNFGLSDKYKDIWFIGWDYAHLGDYMGYYLETSGMKRWTTKEILKEARKQVDDFLKLKLVKKEINVFKK